MSARAGLFRHLTGQSLCPPPRPSDEAFGLLDAYRAEVLREAADEIASHRDDLLPIGDRGAYIRGMTRAIDLLRRMADAGQAPR